MELDRQRLEELIQKVADRLDGDWLLIGGGLVALWLEPRRVTEDVDLIGITAAGAQRNKLLHLAADLGLPIETLNSAADFFVERVEGWRSEIVPFVNGAGGRVFRPTATLFLLLKIGRLSEQDLDDCLALLAHAVREHERIDVARVNGALDAASSAAGVVERRRQLRSRLTALSDSGEIGGVK